MAGLVRVEIVSATDDVTLAGRPRKLQHTTGRKFLFRIDAAEKEVALVRLGLKRRRQAQLQANRLEVLARARVPIRVRVDAARLRPNDVPLLLGDPTRIQTELGWEPEIPLDRTLDDLLDDWRNRPPA